VGNRWNDQWWSLVKAERNKDEHRQRATKKAKRVAVRKKKGE
jgi:hypothetical protein